MVCYREEPTTRTVPLARNSARGEVVPYLLPKLKASVPSCNGKDGLQEGHGYDTLQEKLIALRSRKSARTSSSYRRRAFAA